MYVFLLTTKTDLMGEGFPSPVSLVKLQLGKKKDFSTTTQLTCLSRIISQGDVGKDCDVLVQGCRQINKQ